MRARGTKKILQSFRGNTNDPMVPTGYDWEGEGGWAGIMLETCDTFLSKHYQALTIR